MRVDQRATQPNLDGCDGGRHRRRLRSDVEDGSAPVLELAPNVDNEVELRTQKVLQPPCLPPCKQVVGWGIARLLEDQNGVLVAGRVETLERLDRFAQGL